MNVRNLLEQRHKLAQDDPRRKELDKVIDEEYADSRAIENDFLSRWNGKIYLDSLSEAKQIADLFCEHFGAGFKVKDVIFKDEPWSGGDYNFASLTITMRLNKDFHIIPLLHELAHHLTNTTSKLMGFWGILRAMRERDHGQMYTTVLQALCDHLLVLQNKYDPSLKPSEWYDWRPGWFRYSALELLKRDAADRLASKPASKSFKDHINSFLSYIGVFV